MLIRLLGAVELAASSGWVRAGTPKQCGVLATLALTPGEPVAVQAIVERLWGRDAPETAFGVVYGCVSRLRRLLRGTTVVIARAGADGYRLDVDPDEVDLFRARRLAREAAAADHETAVAAWREAEGLWRGEPLARIAGEWAARTRAAITADRIGVLSGRYEAELALGAHREIIGELQVHVAEHPLAEKLVAHLMLALHRDGRSADALLAFDDLRVRLRDELGHDPGESIRALHRRILNDDPELTATAAPEAKPVRQLPAAVPGFTGRTAALSTLDELLTAHLDAREQGETAPPTIVTVSGVGGVGKTSLAVHWAHGAAAAFPDGQLHIDLAGFAPTGPMDPFAAVDVLLRGLGVSSPPPSQEAQSALLRSTLAGRRVLLLLDNARDAAQVRPLLPGSDAFVIITSRDELRGLHAREGAHPVRLDQFTRTESVSLLSAAAGDRDWDEVAGLCGDLPLALVILAEQAARHPERTPVSLAADLRDDRERLDAIYTDAGEADLRAVFDWSYRTLDPEQARAFRLLALHPGGDVSLPAAAALLDAPEPRIRRVLDRLVGVNLVQSRTHERYAYHDLVRVYAEEKSRELDDADVRHAAQDRILAWYQGTAENAKSQVYPGPVAPFDPLLEEVVPLDFADAEEARAWVLAEHPNLPASVEHAARHGHDGRAWRLAYAIWWYLALRRDWPAWVAAMRTGYAASVRCEDLAAQGRMLNCLGMAHSDQFRLDEAIGFFEEAVAIYRASCDDRSIGVILSNLGVAHKRRGEHGKAAALYAEALETHRRLNNRRAEISVLVNLAAAHLAEHDWDQAAEYASQGVELSREEGHRIGECHNLSNLASALGGLGDYERADSLMAEAMEGYRGLGARGLEAETYVDMAELDFGRNRVDRGRRLLLSALAIFEELGDPRAADVRKRLSAVEEDPAGVRLSPASCAGR